MRFLRDIIELFYPEICVNCNNYLHKCEVVLCADCRHKLPLIKFDSYQNNEMKTVFYGLSSIQNAAAFLYFRKKGITKNLIYELKYKSNQKIGSFIGAWFGEVLKESNQFEDIDFIIPVPLHEFKLKKRGYNQLTTFGTELSRKLNTPYKDVYLKKVSNSKSQTIKNRFDRFTDNNTKFELRNKEVFENKHILLIDDVITSGATLEACCKELQKTENITISIASIAFTAKNNL